MSAKSSQFAVFPGGQSGRGSPGSPGREYQELWFTLARKRWASLALVPVGAGVSASAIATALAEVGSRLRDTPVTAIVAESLDYGAARTLSEIQPRLFEERALSNALEVPAKVVTGRVDGGAAPAVAPLRDAHVISPMARVVIAIRSVVEEPLGVAVAQAADAVLLCVELGVSQLAAARRTIELVGPDRVVGVLLVR